MVSSSKEKWTLSAGAPAENSHAPETVGTFNVKKVVEHIEKIYQKGLKELGGFGLMPTCDDEIPWKHTLDLANVWGVSADLKTSLVPLLRVDCNTCENGYELCGNGFQYISCALSWVENTFLLGFDKIYEEFTRKWKHFLEPSFFPGFFLKKKRKFVC